MRYLKGHKTETRNRIVRNASYGLRENGLEGLGLVDLMKLARLTHGAFYFHFESREALVTEALASAMEETAAHWEELTNHFGAGNALAAIVSAYLTPEHRDNVARGCPLPALSADVARSGLKVRRTFVEHFKKLVDIFANGVSGPRSEAHLLSTAAIATIVGSIVLARAVAVDRTFSDYILAAGRRQARLVATGLSAQAR